MDYLLIPDSLAHFLPFLFAFDLLVEDLQLRKNDRLDVLETLEKTLLGLLLAVSSKLHVVLYLL